MIICEHIIQETEIIGIGPIMLEKFADLTVHEMLNRRKLSFLLVLKHHAIKIESGWLDVGYGDSPDDQEKAARAEYIKFRDEYEAAKLSIVRLINDSKLQTSSAVKATGTKKTKIHQPQTI